MSHAMLHLDDDNFSKETSQGIVLVDFFAEWCGPCRMLTPILDKLSQEMHDTVKFAKLDIDHAQKTTASFGVTSVPTLILFKNGKEVKRIIGLKKPEELKSLITSAI